MDELPYVDEHREHIAQPADAVWTALLSVLRRTFGRSEALAYMLGCDPREATVGFTGVPGDSLPGFRVEAAERGRLLVLRGRHRFSNYQLTFRYDGQILRAQTHAAFPKLRGKLYRTAVVGSGGHRMATRHLLKQVARAVRSVVG